MYDDAQSAPQSITFRGVIQTDTFCAKCGFNLFTQKVWRDPQLDILITRCPECGQHHPAGTHSDASTKWLQRLSLFALLVWVCIALAFIAGTLLFSGLIHTGMAEGMTRRTFIAIDTAEVVRPQWVGSPARYQYITESKAIVAPENVLLRYSLLEVRYDSRTIDRANVSLLEFGSVAAIFVVAWLTSCCLLSAGSWFWKPKLRWLWLVAPVLTGTFLYLMLREDRLQLGSRNGQVLGGIDDSIRFQLLAISIIGQTLIMAFALWKGRAIVRLILSFIAPPKARQALAFLWHCDGKTMSGPPQQRPERP